MELDLLEIIDYSIDNELTPKDREAMEDFVKKDNKMLSNVTKLGSGAFGVIYKVHVKDNDNPIILKAMKISRENINEVNITKILQKGCVQNHVLCYNDSKVIDNHIYLYTDYIPNVQELFKVVSNEKYTIDLNTTYNWFLQLAKAVKYIHSLNLIHLDIKLENILIDDKNNLYLIDYGLACDLNSERKSKTAQCSDIKFGIGSLDYMAPELILQQTQLNDISELKKADVYSLGCIFYTIIDVSYVIYKSNVSEYVLFFKNINAMKFITKKVLNLKTDKNIITCITNMLQIQPRNRYAIDQVIDHVIDHKYKL